MSEHRIVVVQFCDDVRHEMGNKYSLMGCYADELIVDKLPVVLPKLCAQIRAITPIDNFFSKLTFRAKINDDIIAELNIDINKLPDPVPTNSELRRYTVVAAMSFSPLLIAEPCQLRIEAETEDGVIIPGSSLKIRERLPEDPV